MFLCIRRLVFFSWIKSFTCKVDSYCCFTRTAIAAIVQTSTTDINKSQGRYSKTLSLSCQPSAQKEMSTNTSTHTQACQFLPKSIHEKHKVHEVLSDYLAVITTRTPSGNYVNFCPKSSHVCNQKAKATPVQRVRAMCAPIS